MAYEGLIYTLVPIATQNRYVPESVNVLEVDGKKEFDTDDEVIEAFKSLFENAEETYFSTDEVLGYALVYRTAASKCLYALDVRVC